MIVIGLLVGLSHENDECIRFGLGTGGDRTYSDQKIQPSLL
jgi:hypothetical protein